MIKNKVVIYGDYAEIELKRRTGDNFYTKVDLDTFKLIQENFRSVSPLYKRGEGSCYAIGRVFLENGDVKKVFLHRWIMNAPESLQVDHINRKPLDNRKQNLRLVTDAQNKQNKGEQSNNRSGISGVSYRKGSNKWRGRILVEGKRINLGSFDTKEEAGKAVLEARRKYMPFFNEGE